MWYGILVYGRMKDKKLQDCIALEHQSGGVTSGKASTGFALSKK
jgi:hypothetical protein